MSQLFSIPGHGQLVLTGSNNVQGTFSFRHVLVRNALVHHVDRISHAPSSDFVGHNVLLWILALTFLNEVTWLVTQRRSKLFLLYSLVRYFRTSSLSRFIVESLSTTGLP